jgi:ribosomal protein S18 acetylase RimI-like enzyme
MREMIAQISVPARGVLAYHKAGVPVAAALYVVVGNVAIYLNVVTYQGARGMGFGTKVMQAAINGARAAGAEFSAIQVQADNDAARHLYASLGFLEAYSYSYRRPATWSPE